MEGFYPESGLQLSRVWSVLLASLGLGYIAIYLLTETRPFTGTCGSWIRLHGLVRAVSTAPVQGL